MTLHDTGAMWDRKRDLFAFACSRLTGLDHMVIHDDPLGGLRWRFVFDDADHVDAHATGLQIALQADTRPADATWNEAMGTLIAAVANARARGVRELGPGHDQLTS